MIEYHKPKDKGYEPDWYWGYCASSYPLAFKNYPEEAQKFFGVNNKNTDFFYM